MHAEVKIGDSIVMLSDAMGEHQPMPTVLYVYVEDVDAVYKRALRAGGTPVQEPKNEFWGDRHAQVKDAAGNLWWIGTRVEDVSMEEMQRRMQEMMVRQA